MKKLLTTIFLLTVAFSFLLSLPSSVLAKCNAPNPKFGNCYGQKQCSGTSAVLCCDSLDECTAAITDPTHINCTASSVAECLASRPIGCSASGSPYCCDTSNDCSLLGGTVNSGTSHVWPTTVPPVSPVICDPGGGAAGTGINTAIGCIPVLNSDNGTAFTAFILRWAIGVGGGIAFLLILYGGFIVMTSTGNPERLKAGQELLTSAISGLILLIFSVFVLNFVGIKILGIFK